MDLQARARWVDYAEAKDEMFAVHRHRESPWWVVEADDKRRARLNCISHLLSLHPVRGPAAAEGQAAAAARPATTSARPSATRTYVPVRYVVHGGRGGAD